MSPSSIPKVYFDSNVLIELAKMRVGLHDPNRANDLWFFQQMLKASQAGELRLYTSALTIAECVHVDQVYDAPTQQFFSGILLSGSMVTLVQSSVFVAEYARDLRWKHNIKLKPIDSIHVASALDAECKEMLSWDMGISKPERAAQIATLQSMKLAVILPSQTAALPSSYTQQNLAIGSAPASSPPRIN
jgi:hypothetical protein